MTTIATEPFTRSYTADPVHSSFEAELRHMGVAKFRTSFDDVTARLEHTQEGVRLTGEARVDSIAIRRPAEFREHVVNGADFFDAANHPVISFASHELRFSSDGTVSFEGTLTMRGVERPVSVTGSYREPLEDVYGGTRAALDLTATIDRREWGFAFQAQLPKGGDVLSWDVTIGVHLELVAD